MYPSWCFWLPVAIGSFIVGSAGCLVYAAISFVWGAL